MNCIALYQLLLKSYESPYSPQTSFLQSNILLLPVSKIPGDIKSSALSSKSVGKNSMLFFRPCGTYFACGVATPGSNHTISMYRIAENIFRHYPNQILPLLPLLHRLWSTVGALTTCLFRHLNEILSIRLRCVFTSSHILVVQRSIILPHNILLPRCLDASIPGLSLQMINQHAVQCHR